MVTRLSIQQALELKNTIFLDARTPKEFEEDHIQEAINLPILTNEERHEVGIIYKQLSREKAIEKGLEYLPEKIPRMMEIYQKHREKNIVVYCARGGMRSQIVASLLDSIGCTVYKIEGGYKLFRQYILDQLDQIKVKPKLIVLYGLTCTGKTKILQKFSNSLDLEGLAQHRSSIYGAVGLKPNSQKKFENLLLQKLSHLQNEKYIIVEGESRRIGDCIIPEKFWKAMKKGYAVLVTRDFDLRVEEMINEYFTNEENIVQIKKITTTLKRVIGEKKKQEVLDALDSGDYKIVGNRLLGDYYDPLYSHTLKQQEFMFEVCNDDIEKAVGELRSKLKSANAQTFTLTF